MKQYIAFAVIGLALIGAACQKQTTQNTTPPPPPPATTTNQPTNTTVSTTVSLPWQQGAEGYMPIGTPPACPNPLVLQPPVDVATATSILYPGQTRGGNYKPHGGFRFDTALDNNKSVTVPIDAFVVNGGQYLVDGDLQYTFDFINPCGIMFRLGHLKALSPKFQQLASVFPAAMEGDSRTTNINPPVAVQAGDEIATQIGVLKTGLNVFVDFGVYDLREKNAASKNAAWAASHDPLLAQRALCWFDLLPAADAARVKSLPAGDPTSGKASDYCD